MSAAAQSRGTAGTQRRDAWLAATEQDLEKFALSTCDHPERDAVINSTTFDFQFLAGVEGTRAAEARAEVTRSYS